MVPRKGAAVGSQPVAGPQHGKMTEHYAHLVNG